MFSVKFTEYKPMFLQMQIDTKSIAAILFPAHEKAPFVMGGQTERLTSKSRM